MKRREILHFVFLMKWYFIFTNIFRKKLFLLLEKVIIMSNFVTEQLSLKNKKKKEEDVSM